jgi:hypothetical protein
MSRWFIAAVTGFAFALALLAAAPVAIADLQTGSGTVAADTAATAFPAQPGVTYQGTLNPDTATYHDLDYLSFTVSAGETIQFTDQNTTTSSDPNFALTCDQYCPVYLSLDKPNPSYPPPPDALGLCDGAGTLATYGDTEIFNWTFGQAGTYYMIMESDGDLPLSYAVSYAVVSSSGGTDSCQTAGTGGSKCKHHCNPGGGGSSGSTTSPPPPAPPPPLVRFVRVSPAQAGTSVKATVTLGQWGKYVRVALLLHHKTIRSIRRSPVGPGRHRYKVVLPAVVQRMLAARHKLSLAVQITVHGRSGVTQTFNRHVTLRSS